MEKEIINDMYNKPKNLIVNGDVAVGKTTKVMFSIVEDLIGKEENFIVLDSKEEYLNRFYKKLQEKEYEIIIINFNDLNKSECWNPLKYPYKLYKEGNKDKATELVEKLAKVMFYELGASDPFWSRSAADLFVGIVLSLFDDAEEDEINLVSVNAVLDGFDIKYENSDGIKEYFKDKSPSSQAYIYASNAILAPSETKGGIIAVARQKLRVFVSREKLNQLLNKTTFNVDDLVNNKVAFFVIGREDSKYLNDLATIFIEQLFRILLMKQLEKRFNFILDNFDDLEFVNDFSEMLKSALSKNIKFAIVTRLGDEIYSMHDTYIGKVCNEIKLINKEMLFIEANETTVIDNELENITYQKNEIKYPELSSSAIKVFDLIKFLNVKPKNLVDNKVNDNDKGRILETIDKRIAELELEESYNRALDIDSNDIELELQQFKIED